MMRRSRGFTLSELLIALVILGLIATFTIPKVLSSQQDTQFNARAKEFAGFLSEARQVLVSDGSLNGATMTQDVMNLLNYVKVETTGLVDAWYNSTTRDCATNVCYRLRKKA